MRGNTETNYVESIDFLPIKEDIVKTSKDAWKIKKCKIINYNKGSNILVIDFDGKYLQLSVPDDYKADINHMIYYKGEPGKNFELKR